MQVAAASHGELLQELGSGACGTVRLARHRASGQLVALKAINIADQAQRHQLLNELGVLVGLAHAHAQTETQNKGGAAGGADGAGSLRRGSISGSSGAM